MKRGWMALVFLGWALAASGCADYRATVRAEQALQEAEQALAAGQTAKAQVLLLRAATLRPDSALVRARVGLQMLAAARPAAVGHLEAALRSPGWMPPQVRLAAIDCYLALGEQSLAEQALLGALPAYPRDAEALNLLGYSCADRGVLLPQARQVLERAVALAPEEGAVLDSLGWALIKLGQLAQGRVLLEQADQRMRNNYEITYHLAVAALLAGERPEAERQLVRSLALNPSYQPALALQRTLEGARKR